MVLKHNGETVCDIPLGPLADDAPKYDRPAMSKADYKVWAQVKPLGDIPESTDIAADLLKLMASPDIASRRWIWEQYDHMVGADTVQRPGGDAAVVRVHGTDKGIAISTDCTPRYCYADPYEGGKQAIAECYRNLSAVGATPLAVTNCLNFGNPQRPEIMAQFVGCLEGMADACRALDFPIVSGNVSLYNESKATGGGSAILPTPAIGGIGLLADWRKSATIGFKAEGEAIYLVHGLEGHLGQSLWLREIHGREDGTPPPVNLTVERNTGEFIRQLIELNVVSSVHDVSDGGTLIAVAEMCLAGNIGAILDDSYEHTTADLFGECQGSYVIAFDESHFDAVINLADGRGVEFVPLGQTAKSALTCGDSYGQAFNIPLATLRAAHEGFFPKLMGAAK